MRENKSAATAARFVMQGGHGDRGCAPQTIECDRVGTISIFKPSMGYYRRALRVAKTKREAVRAGIAAVDEFERLREWVNKTHGYCPVWRVLRKELDDKRNDEDADYGT